MSIPFAAKVAMGDERITKAKLHTALWGNRLILFSFLFGEDFRFFLEKLCLLKKKKFKRV